MVVGAVAAVAVVVLAVLILRDGPVARVVLVGDSIAEEAAPYLKPALGETQLVERDYGGTAPCDWLEADVPANEDDAVVISFTGNSFTPCMEDGAGGHLQGQALIDKYQADLAALVERVRESGAPVVLVGQPERGPGADGADEVAGINDIYRALARDDGVSFVDAGAAVETPDGGYAADLPCLPGEDECGPNGRNAVRSDDGVHLCPGASRAPCPVYSSGAFRFAGAIAEAIDER